MSRACHLLFSIFPNDISWKVAVMHAAHGLHVCFLLGPDSRPPDAVVVPVNLPVRLKQPSHPGEGARLWLSSIWLRRRSARTQHGAAAHASRQDMRAAMRPFVPSIRVCVVQPVLPHYRQAVFNRLGAIEGVSLSIWAGATSPGSPPTANPGSRPAYHFELSPTAAVGPLLWQPAQWRAVRAGAFDVVVLSWNIRYIHLIPALLRARAFGVPVVLWGHGQSPRDTTLRRWVRRRTARLASVSCLYAGIAAARLVAEGAHAAKVIVAPNALDQAPIRGAAEWWTSRPEALEEFRLSNGINSRELVLSVCRLNEGRDLDVLFCAMKSLQQARPKLQAIVIGDGPDRERLEHSVRERGLAGSVRFVGALYEERYLAPWFLSAALVACPGSVGLGILHAFGYALPVVASDDLNRHSPEIEYLVDGVNGLLYRDREPASLASRIVQLLSSPSQAQVLSEGALRTVSEGAGTLDAMVGGLALAIRTAASPKGLSPVVRQATEPPDPPTSQR